jgi:PAS domain-containing protein
VDAGTQWEAWQVFEHCPCPLFRLDGDGRLQLANAALCQFLGAPREEILGKALHKTRLGRIYPDLEEDLDGCLATRSALQRVVAYQASEQQSVRFLLWIVPFPRSAGRSNALSGIILPYPGEGS